MTVVVISLVALAGMVFILAALHDHERLRLNKLEKRVTDTEEQLRAVGRWQARRYLTTDVGE